MAKWSAHRAPNVAVPGSSHTLLKNSPLVAFCQLGFLILLCCMFELFVSKHLSGLPVNYRDKLSALSTINKYLNL